MRTIKLGAVAGSQAKPGPALNPVWSATGKILESDLAKIWADQRFSPSALTFADGRSPRVILPGRPGGGKGPDFRDAVIAIDGHERRGDVELHLHASSFRAHGHDKDPAYGRVVLHVVIWADAEERTILNNGHEAPIAAFESWLANRSEEMTNWLDNPASWREPCTQATQRLGEAGVDSVLTAEGEARFALKRGRFLDSIAAHGETVAFWQALLDGLGYGGERFGWRRLAQALPPDKLRELAPPNSVERILMAVAGLTGPPDDVIGLPPAINPVMKPVSRPANDPRYRLAALARLWQRADGDLPAFACASLRDSASVSELVDCWQVKDSEQHTTLLGRQRATELVFNLVLPYVATKPDLKLQAEIFVRDLRPVPAYGKTAGLERNLKRPDGRRRVQRALQQQGLLALNGNWCRRGGCGRCPLS